MEERFEAQQTIRRTLYCSNNYLSKIEKSNRKNLSSYLLVGSKIIIFECAIGVLRLFMIKFSLDVNYFVEYVLHSFLES